MKCLHRRDEWSCVLLYDHTTTPATHDKRTHTVLTWPVAALCDCWNISFRFSSAYLSATTNIIKYQAGFNNSSYRIHVLITRWMTSHSRCSVLAGPQPPAESPHCTPAALKYDEQSTWMATIELTRYYTISCAYLNVIHLTEPAACWWWTCRWWRHCCRHWCNAWAESYPVTT